MEIVTYFSVVSVCLNYIRFKIVYVKIFWIFEFFSSKFSNQDIMVNFNESGKPPLKEAKSQRLFSSSSHLENMTYFLWRQFFWVDVTEMKICSEILLSLSIKDDSDYLAFKETSLSYTKFVYRSAFLCEPVPPLSAHSNFLYDDNKYANGTTICTVWTVNDVLSRSTPFFSKGYGLTQ